MEKDNETAVITAEKEHKVPGVPFVKGDSRINTSGRPKGSLSVIGRLKQIFEENPKDFEEFVMSYKNDAKNQKHIVEMLDGKPRQNIGLDGGSEGVVVRFASEFNKQGN